MTRGARIRPKATTVALRARANPVPVTTSVWPPRREPRLRERPVTDGGRPTLRVMVAVASWRGSSLSRTPTVKR
jgi:hypothetical protein